ncbi:flippase [Fulvivirga ligni]|uniref:flippase n=1 Tax=Fulvivirga ligni TaxID=2904246 RepID=UPI001F2E9322|nr:flippase [Fulvivirga ligni]UII22660.1 flippase [Fulvivirga ligni]
MIKLLDLTKKISLYKRDADKAKILKNISWLFFDKFVSTFLSLLSGILLVRYLGPDQFGVLSFSQSIFIMLTAICKLGLDNIVVREIVENDKHQDSIISSAFLMKSILTLSTYCILMLIVLPFGVSTPEKITLIFCLGLIFQPIGILDLFFQTRSLSKYLVISKVIGVIICSLLKFLCIYLEASLTVIALVFLLEPIITFGVLGYIYFSRSNQLKWRPKLSFSKFLLKSSWLLLLSSMSVTLYLKVDVIMIKYFLSFSEVGIYSSAVRISEGWYFIPQAMVISLFPTIIKAKAESLHKYYSQLQKLMNVMVWLSLFLALIVFFTGDYIIHFLYGEKYQAASSVLSIHIWSGIFVFLGFVSGRWLIIERMEFYAFKRSFYGALVNVVLNLILIPQFGINGAAIATFFSMFTSMYLAFYIDRRTRHIFYMKTKSLLFHSLWKKLYQYK